MSNNNNNDSDKLPYWVEIEQYIADNKQPIEKNAASQDKDNEYWVDVERFIMGRGLN